MEKSLASGKDLKIKIIIGLLLVYVFWGGTYVAMKFAIQTIPPFITAGTRFTTAGLILYIVERIKGSESPQMIHWKKAAIVGLLMLLGGNGGVIWAQQVVPSGIAAIIAATVPLWMTLIGWMFFGSRRPGGKIVFGLLLGFSGILLLVKNTGVIERNDINLLIGYAVILLATFCWALGSIYSRTAQTPTSPLMGVALQMICGGMGCLAASVISGNWKGFDIMRVSMPSLIAFLYLVFFGSIIGFSAYIWLLRVANPTLVSTYAYVNPIVAVFLGWLFAGERMSIFDLFAAMIILTAVVIITKASGEQRANDPVKKAPIKAEA